MAISTKKGDNGDTDLFNQARVKKSDIRIITLAAIDELNSYIGLILAKGSHELFLEKIQNNLFELGAIVADPESKNTMSRLLGELEAREREVESSIPPIKNFILPGGSEISSFIHIARSVCRRAETDLVQIFGMDPSCMQYINRLSDYLFLLARKENIDSEKKEVIWKKM